MLARREADAAEMARLQAASQESTIRRRSLEQRAQAAETTLQQLAAQTRTLKPGAPAEKHLP